MYHDNSTHAGCLLHFIFYFYLLLYLQLVKLVIYILKPRHKLPRIEPISNRGLSIITLK